jgi:SAM-dependent methyltransferase
VLTPLDDSHAAFDVTDDRAMKALAAAEEAHFWHRARNRFIADRLGALGIPASARVLELGCGGGCVTSHLAMRGYDVVGVDGHAELVARAAMRSQNAKFFVHDLAKGLDALPLRDFDVVALFDVIEHLDDPRTALAQALTRAKPGGWIVGTVPALMSLWSDVDVQAGHKLRYDKAALEALMSSLEGTTDARVVPFYRALVPMLFLQRKLVVKRGDVGATSEKNFAVPPKPVNAALYSLVRAEARLSRLLDRTPLAGSCLWFQARRSSLRGNAPPDGTRQDHPGAPRSPPQRGDGERWVLGRTREAALWIRAIGVALRELQPRVGSASARDAEAFSRLAPGKIPRRRGLRDGPHHALLRVGGRERGGLRLQPQHRGGRARRDARRRSVGEIRRRRRDERDAAGRVALVRCGGRRRLSRGRVP